MNKNIVIIFAGALCAGVIAYVLFRTDIVSNLTQEIPEKVENTANTIGEKPLEKYSIPNLRTHTFQSSEIIIGEVLKDEKDFTSYMFYYYVDEMAGTPRKKVSGLINVPKKTGNYPIIVMFRGYIPPETFKTGEGTRRSGELLAQAGFITVAPDFLGFGESDKGADLGLENRFETYPTAITLLESLNNINPALEKADITNITANSEKIGVWGHSNGGHIGLTSLAITEKEYPTVFWNPVSKEFPYSIMVFMDEHEDDGKVLRKVIADFERDYDIDEYSPPNYYKHINAKIQLHQGAIDEAVPKRWSDEFVENMKQMDKEVEYFVYPGDDHNFWQGSYDTVIKRTIAFYQKELK